MSSILRAAFDRWADMRDAFELRRHAQYERAVGELRGELLSRRGTAAGVDAYSLFMGPWPRARAYASEELLEWWTRPGNARMTVAQFEQQWTIEQDHYG